MNEEKIIELLNRLKEKIMSNFDYMFVYVETFFEELNEHYKQKFDKLTLIENKKDKGEDYGR